MEELDIVTTVLLLIVAAIILEFILGAVIANNPDDE